MGIPHLNDLCFLFLEFLGATAHIVLTELAVIRNFSVVVWLRLRARLHIFLDPPMAKLGGGGGWIPPLQQVFRVFLGNGKSFYSKQNFICSLILGTSVHEKRFQIGLTVFALKLDKRRVLGVAMTLHGLLFTYFSNHEHDIKS